MAAADFWPEGTQAGVDSSFFYLPPIDEQYGRPVLGGGDVFSAFNTRPETAALMEYLSLPEGAPTRQICEINQVYFIWESCWARSRPARERLQLLHQSDVIT
jgi:hypothetical protein